MTISNAGNKAEKRLVPIIEEQGRALMQAVPDLVFLLGLDGRYIDIFSAADQDLFLPREQLIGRTVLDVLPPPVGEDCMAAIRKLTSPRDVSTFSYELQIEGKNRCFEGRVTLCGKDAVIILVRDFTEQRSAERKLLAANTALHRRAQRLQQLEQELTRVEQRERRRMAQLLHDNLQQLLVGAKFNLSVLADRLKQSENSERAKEVIEILDEMLQQSRSLTAELYPTSLYEGSLEQSLDWIKNHAARLHGLDVDVSIHTSSSVYIKESVRFIMYNAIQELLLNVAKHAGVKKVSINISTPSPDRITVTVKDDGQGFSPSLLEHPEGDLKRFGLFNLQERIAWLRGIVNISSQPGAGCTVKLSLPVEEDASPSQHDMQFSPLMSAQEPYTSRSDNAGEEGPIRVILVDDHTLIRVGLARILREDSSFTIVGEAPDGETAVKLAAELNPDVILMDVSMPGMGGAEATRIIKQANPNIQIIALSMYEEREQGTEMRKAGATSYVNKSEAASTIADAIRSCCTQKN